jgi:hypothetical protein
MAPQPLRQRAGFTRGVRVVKVLETQIAWAQLAQQEGWHA